MTAEQVFEMGVLSILAWPGVRAAGSRAYRRVFPYDSIRIGAAAALYLTVVIGIAVYDPRWLRALLIPGASVGAFLLWRARPGYGVAAGLPPGSLFPLPVGPWNDPEFYAKHAARYGSVFKMSQFGQPMACVVGLERVNRLLVEYDHQLVAPPLPFNRFIEGGYLRYLPEETHARYRKLFASLFYSDAMTLAAPRVAAVFRDGVTTMTETSAATGSVLVKPAFMRMMFTAWMELFYGIDARHPDFARLKALFHVIDIRKARWASRRRVGPALEEIEAILRREVDSLASGATARPCLLDSLARSDMRALDDRTILGNLIYITQVTWGDVTGLLLWVFKMLTDHPEWRHRLAREHSREQAHDLATRIVEETLRLEQSESRYRRAVSDLELDGFRIPRGWLVRMCIRESHRDEKLFPNPLRFDPDRFRGRTFTRGEYAPFGAYRLSCIGEDITKTVAALLAIELTSGFDWEVVEDGPAQISSWVHNAPNPRLRVKIAPRAHGR